MGCIAGGHEGRPYLAGGHEGRPYPPGEYEGRADLAGPCSALE